MTRLVLVWVAAVLLATGCAAVPVPSDPAVIATPGPTASTTRLGLTTEIREGCGSIGGCAAYAALVTAGGVEIAEVDVSGLAGDPVVTDVLPTLIEPGAYVVRFRLAAVSDARVAGSPPDETTIARCEVPIEVTGQAAVEVSVVFHRDACEAEATDTVETVD